MTFIIELLCSKTIIFSQVSFCAKDIAFCQDGLDKEAQYV
jgi:hypothetical protein